VSALDAFEDLHRICVIRGARLLSVSVACADGRSIRRAYSSHPVQYPVGGIKPLLSNAWYETVFLRQRHFVANRPEEFRALFADHALIESLGLAAILNIPVVDHGVVRGTINILGAQDHFTPANIGFYATAIDGRGDTLREAMVASAKG
jgi:hypothetical protein